MIDIHVVYKIYYVTIAGDYIWNDCCNKKYKHLIRVCIGTLPVKDDVFCPTMLFIMIDKFLLD